ncbi:MAG: Fe-S cluster assembly protein HesB [Erysipelothrix sp.]|nr:Fe-S cluster assembly protein HesB [Erysipelothrix sp.]
MKLIISNDAADWYIKEMHLNEGDSIKFFGKVYGVNGFSIALSKEEPSRPLAETTVKGITFFVERADTWFFEDNDLNITLDETLKEPKYTL